MKPAVEKTRELTDNFFILTDKNYILGYNFYTFFFK